MTKNNIPWSIYMKRSVGGHRSSSQLSTVIVRMRKTEQITAEDDEKLDFQMESIHTLELFQQ